MCITVEMDDITIYDLAGMREALGREPVYSPDCSTNAQTPGEFCLCGIDHVETAKLIGRRAEFGDWGDMEYVKAQEG